MKDIITLLTSSSLPLLCISFLFRRYSLHYQFTHLWYYHHHHHFVWWHLLAKKWCNGWVLLLFFPWMNIKFRPKKNGLTDLLVSMDLKITTFATVVTRLIDFCRSRHSRFNFKWIKADVKVHCIRNLLSLTLTLTLTLSHSHSLTLSHSHSVTHSLTLTHSLSLSHSLFALTKAKKVTLKHEVYIAVAVSFAFEIEFTYVFQKYSLYCLLLACCG